MVATQDWADALGVAVAFREVAVEAVGGAGVMMEGGVAADRWGYLAVAAQPEPAAMDGVAAGGE